MSTDARRRNGSAPSCEPCRRAKTRCGHEKPICARCRRRGPDTRCWYHPHPLTKRPRLGGLGQSPESVVSQPATPRPHIVDLPPWAHMINKSKNWVPRTPDTGVRDQRLHDEHLAVVLEVLEQLRNWPLIERRVRDYLSISQVPMAPVPLTFANLVTIRESSLVANYTSSTPVTDEMREDRLRYAEDVLRSSSVDVKITPTMTVLDFQALYTSENLRVEYLGLVYALASRGMLYGINRDNHRYDDFTQSLFRCSNLSLRLARDVAPQPNDAILWLAHENLQVLTLIEGDASLGVWRRLGDLSSDVLALGIHRESTHSATTTPHFLAEMRRRTFCSIYQYDKSYATLFDRPPRLPKLYSDCKLPLDLTDEQVLADTPEELENAKACLTEDGWNVEQIYMSATWCRLRFVLGGFREEMIQHYLGTTTPATEDQLWDLSNRCRDAWDSLPAYLKYNRQSWDTDMPVPITFMLGKIYLSYLHIEFHVRRLLAKTDPREQLTLWEVSNTMLEVVLQQGATRDRDVYLPRDLPAVMFAYGLFCATILCSALQEVTRDLSKSLPPGLNRATLIRNLSVFIADLESACGPGSLNHEFCSQASKAISKALDDVLNGVISPKDALPDATGMHLLATPSSLPALHNPTDPSVAGVEDFATMDFNNFDIGNFDLADWSINIDWTGTNGEWNIF